MAARDSAPSPNAGPIAAGAVPAIDPTPAVDATQLREAIKEVLPTMDMNTTSIKVLRTELEKRLGLAFGGLDGQREQVKDLLQDELCRAQADSRPAQKPSTFLDVPLSALSSIENLDDLVGSSSDSDRDTADKKSRMSKRARNEPTPLRKHDRKRHGASKKVHKMESRENKENKAERFKRKVVEAVQQYVSENPNSWTASEMREDIANRNGWDNDTRLANVVKASVFELGFNAAGGQVVKGCK